MSGSVLLVGGLVALGLAIALLVIAVVPARPREGGVAHALAAIDQSYSQSSSAAADDGDFLLPGWLRSLALRLSPSGVAAKLQRRLDLAGNPGRWTPDRVLAAKGLGLIALAMLGALVGLRNPVLLIVCAAVGGAAGFFLPDVLLFNAGQKRQAKLQVALPDALDMLTICVEAGLGFDAALGHVAQNTTGPLSGEFFRVLKEMQIGKGRSEAFQDLAERTTVDELHSFVSALVQADRQGIPIAAVLREQAKEMRLRRRQAAEEAAAKVPVKILFPLVVCILPAMFVVIIGPGAVQIVQAFTGQR